MDEIDKYIQEQLEIIKDLILKYKQTDDFKQEMKKAQKELLEEYFKFERKDRNSFMISELNKLSNN